MLIPGFRGWWIYKAWCIEKDEKPVCNHSAGLPCLRELFQFFFKQQIFAWSKLIAFADDKLDAANLVIVSAFDRVENIVGKGENAGHQHFLLFQQYFRKASSKGSLKVGIVWYRVNKALLAS